MQLVKLATLWVSFSILIAGCSGAPPVTVCVLDPAKGGGQCCLDQDCHFKTFDEMANYGAMSPDDIDALTTYIKRKLDNCK